MWWHRAERMSSSFKTSDFKLSLASFIAKAWSKDIPFESLFHCSSPPVSLSLSQPLPLPLYLSPSLPSPSLSQYDDSFLTFIDSTRDPMRDSRGPTRSLTGMEERTHPMAATNRTESRDSKLDRLAYKCYVQWEMWSSHSIRKYHKLTIKYIAEISATNYYRKMYKHTRN